MGLTITTTYPTPQKSLTGGFDAFCVACVCVCVRVSFGLENGYAWMLQHERGGKRENN